MGFLEIPNEILVQILQYLPLNNLPKVSLSSRRFHNIVEPILYTSFVQRGRTAVSQLIRTILDKPHLGRHFKYIDLLDIRRSKKGKQLREKIFNLKYGVMVRKQINEYVRAGHFKYNYELGEGKLLCDQQMAHEWYTNIFHHKLNFDTTAAFLLLLLPNLEHFSLEKYEISHKTVLSVLLAAQKMQRSAESSNDVGSLSRLRVLNLEMSYDRGHFLPIKAMIQISEMPSLQKLSCSGIRESDGIIFKHEPTTRHLSLLNSQVRLLELEYILPNFNRLQSFTIEFQDGWKSPDYGDNVFTTVIRCITQTQNTLEALKIINNKYCGRVTGEEFQSLVCFSKLRVLEIEGDFLNHPAFTFASFPLSLAYLILHNSDKAAILRHLHISLETLAMVPNLISVDVIPRRLIYESLDWELSDELRDGFIKHGVTMRIVPVAYL